MQYSAVAEEGTIGQVYDHFYACNASKCLVPRSFEGSRLFLDVLA